MRCNAFLERAKRDAKTDDFGTVCTLSDPVVQLRAEAEKEEVEENYGGLVITALGFALTSFLAP